MQTDLGGKIGINVSLSHFRKLSQFIWSWYSLVNEFALKIRAAPFINPSHELKWTRMSCFPLEKGTFKFQSSDCQVLLTVCYEWINVLPVYTTGCPSVRYCFILCRNCILATKTSVLSFRMLLLDLDLRHLNPSFLIFLCRATWNDT